MPSDAIPQRTDTPQKVLVVTTGGRCAHCRKKVAERHRYRDGRWMCLPCVNNWDRLDDAFPFGADDQ